MCETLEMFKRQGREEANVQAISNLLRDSLVTPEQISKSFNIPISVGLEIEKNIKYRLSVFAPPCAQRSINFRFRFS